MDLEGLFNLLIPIAIFLVWSISKAAGAKQRNQPARPAPPPRTQAADLDEEAAPPAARRSGQRRPEQRPPSRNDPLRGLLRSFDIDVDEVLGTRDLSPSRTMEQTDTPPPREAAPARRRATSIERASAVREKRATAKPPLYRRPSGGRKTGPVDTVDDIHDILASPQRLRSAVVMSEILGPPVSLRDE